MDHTQLAVVIVTWNVRELVLDCLRSVYEDLGYSDLRGEVWVVDNRSIDGTPELIKEHFPQTHLIEAEDNLGFARGNNLALHTMGFPDSINLPSFVLLLNPDTFVKPGALRELIAGMEAEKAGLAGARLVYGDGSFQHSAFEFPGLAQLIIDLFPVPGRFIESSLNGRYPREWYLRQQPFEVDHPLGATFMLRREVIQNVGVFDEQFWLYCEEIDWAKRIKEAGYKIICVPTAEVVHLEGQSTTQVKPQAIVNLWASRVKYYRKHYGLLKRQVALWLLRLGMNYQIKKTARDAARPEGEREALVDAYREVIDISKKS